MIVIIDYGVGNVLAFVNAFTRLNIPVAVATSAKDLGVATKLILPGVGSFDHAMLRLRQSGMQESVEELVQQEAMPVLGICVGMQMLATSSEEGALSGLGWINGTVKKFDRASMPADCNLPHMGWNDVKPASSSPLFSNLEQDCRFYFLHSYYFECADKSNVLASTDYGGQFSCAVQKNNIYGVQFHPEKSHSFGSSLLKNFAEL
jgi:imidazole glycerol-phosphate synthase subunit HisH